MASIKQLDDRRFKITVSNGYRPDGKKICKAKTIRVPESIPKRGIRQYVSHEAEELERQFKSGYGEDGNMTFEEFAERWLARQVRYAPSTLESYRRMLGRMYPFIGSVPINRLRLQWQWAIAMPRASAVSSGLGTDSRCSIMRVIS